MAAPKGNQFWLARATHGRDKIFSTPQILWEAALEYFQWIEEHPLEEQKLFSYQGSIVKGDATKMRAMTVEGLCLFLDIDRSTWYDYAKKEDFSNIIIKIEDVMKSQKFAGAAADLLNPNIIARDLGLKDITKKEITGEGGRPIEVLDMTDFTKDELELIKKAGLKLKGDRAEE